MEAYKARQNHNRDDEEEGTDEKLQTETALGSLVILMRQHFPLDTEKELMEKEITGTNKPRRRDKEC